MKRLLVPVVRVKSARKVLDYLIRRSVREKDLVLCLLHVEESVSQWSALMGRRTRSQQLNSVDQLFDELLRILNQHNLEHCAYVRTGGVVFTILDTAEELDCHEIVMPPPAKGIRQLWSRGIVWHAMKKQRRVPVVLTG